MARITHEITLDLDDVLQDADVQDVIDAVGEETILERLEPEFIVKEIGSHELLCEMKTSDILQHLQQLGEDEEDIVKLLEKVADLISPEKRRERRLEKLKQESLRVQNEIEQLEKAKKE